MLKITQSIKNLTFDDIGDNPYHYEYDKEISILSRLKQNTEEEKIRYAGHFRSLEGKFFENYLVEKLIRYAIKNPNVKYILAKGLHKINKNTFYNTLTVNHKGQIIYRANHKEIGEFDALLLTHDNALYFVEMTLNKDLTALKKRMRKKKAILDTIFPQYDIKALIITTTESIGTQNIPDFALIWETNPFNLTQAMFNQLNIHGSSLKEYQYTRHFKLISPSKVRIEKFNYYQTLLDIMTQLRNNGSLLNLEYVKTDEFERLHNLFTKIYIGQIGKSEFCTLFGIADVYQDATAILGIEKRHTGEFVVNYYIAVSKKELHAITIENGKTKIVKKDPFGMTMSEIAHIRKHITQDYNYSSDTLSELLRIIQAYNQTIPNG